MVADYCAPRPRAMPDHAGRVIRDRIWIFATEVQDTTEHKKLNTEVEPAVGR